MLVTLPYGCFDMIIPPLKRTISFDRDIFMRDQNIKDFVAAFENTTAFKGEIVSASVEIPPAGGSGDLMFEHHLGPIPGQSPKTFAVGTMSSTRQNYYHNFFVMRINRPVILETTLNQWRPQVFVIRCHADAAWNPGLTNVTIWIF